MSFLLEFAGFLLILLLFVLLFVLAFCTTVFFSKISVVFDYSKSLNIFLKLWFVKINVTKLMSRKKKHKKPKTMHFSGGSFGCSPEEKKKVTQKAPPPHSAKKTITAKDKKSISEILEFIKDILSEMSPHLSKCTVVKIHRLKLTAATKEAADTAVLFGHFNTAVSSLMLVCEKYKAFYINADCVGVYSDFTTAQPILDTEIELQISVRHVGLSSFKAFMFFLKNK